MSKPSIILVPGAWHGPGHFTVFVEVLERHGYHCVTVDLPTMQSGTLPAATLADDTAAIRKAVIYELDAGNNVVVTAHSYAGAPTSNALRGFDSDSRTATGSTTAVIAIIFISAVALPVGGQIMESSSAPPPTPIHDFSRNPDYAYVGGLGPKHHFYHDVALEDQDKYVAMLRPQAVGAYLKKTEYAAYVDFPCWYLFCTKDQAVPLTAQQHLVVMIKANGARIQTEAIESGHSPFLSMPEETASFITRVAADPSVARA